MTTNSQSSLRTGYLLIVILIVMSGISWPIVKMALEDISPLWLAFWRFFIGMLCVFIYLVVTKKFRLPTTSDLPMIFSVSLLQMAGFVALTNIALMHVPANRSAILAYTTPIWVMPLALVWLKEPISRLKAIGLGLGVLGILVLFNPASFDWHNRQEVLGNSLLILAAIMWAINIVHIRAVNWTLTPLQLLPWQMLIAAVLLFFLAVYFEPDFNIHWTSKVIALLFYIGLIATALGYWLNIEVTRKLPSITTSLCMLGVPIFGLFSSHFILGEIIYLNVIIAVFLILLGLIFVIKSE